MGYIHYMDGRIDYEERDVMVSRGNGRQFGYALKCYECNRHTTKWVAAELPSAAEDMCRAMDLVFDGAGSRNNFYMFIHEYRLSFPECGHQDVRTGCQVWRFYGPA